MKTALQQYIDLGWYLLPVHEITDGHCSCGDSNCRSPGKHPRAGIGLNHASTDPKTIAGWLESWPDCSWAVTCRRSGFVAIDVDPRAGGNATFAELVKAHGELPPGPVQKTGGDGRHYLLTVPRGAKLRGGLGHGVDLKANGYILIEPSNHISGGTYIWATHPSSTPVPPMPVTWFGVAEKRAPAPRCVPRDFAPSDDDEVESALAAVPADDREVWLEMGMAVHDALGDGGYSVWDRWSQSSEKYHSGDARRVWDSIKPGGGVKKATLFKTAMSYGWEQPRRSRPALSVVPRNENPPPHTDDDVPAEAEPEEDWRVNLIWKDPTTQEHLTRDGGNATMVVCNDPVWTGCLRYNKFSKSIEWGAPAPVIVGYPAPEGELTDEHVGYVAHWLLLNYGGSFSMDAVRNAVQTAASFHGYHPVMEYLSGLQWDGVPRLDTWMQTYLGSKDLPIISDIGRWWMVSAVARILKPGCQVDHSIILEGPQGVGKSSALSILGGSWYKSSLGDIKSKDCRIGLHGSWIVEIAELDSFRGMRETAIKDFLTERVDKFRPPYGRQDVTFARQCVFAGTTNETSYQQDATGARRFWSVKAHNLDRVALVRDRDQLWAEAAHMYRDGVGWWPTTDEQQAELGERAEDRYVVDPWEERIGQYLQMHSGEDVSTDELLGWLQVEVEHRDRRSQMRVGAALRRAGWYSVRYTVDGVRTRRYRLREWRS